jgi:TetR/AcrR family transcriptional regulator, transcriptional repressor for nem operon
MVPPHNVKRSPCLLRRSRRSALVCLQTVRYVSLKFDSVKQVADRQPNRYIPDGLKCSLLRLRPAGPGPCAKMPWGMEKKQRDMAKRTARRRQPDITREKLLQAAFHEIYRHGFQGASLDVILATAGVTKGALYHHFPDKAALGHAVVEEVVHGLLLERWLGVLERQPGDPLTALQGMLRQRARELTTHEVELGCPLNNLAQEMSPLDERFRRRVSATFDTWIDGFSEVLAKGQAEGTVRGDVNPRQVAGFLVGAVEGCYGLAKSARSKAMLRANLEVLSRMLDSLRVPPPTRSRTQPRRR